MSATTRLATDRPVVCIEQPSFAHELLVAFSALLLMGWLMAAGELTGVKDERDAALADAAHWKQVALTPDAPDHTTRVRLVRDGSGFVCEQFNVRREWERAVAVQCEVLGSLLMVARTTP